MTLPVEVVKGKDKPGRLGANQTRHYSPSEITLYGTLLDYVDACIGSQVSLVETNVGVVAAGLVTFRPALIYAFAYQGHCYYLPEPVILIVEGGGDPAEGFDFEVMNYQNNPPTNDTPYLMWRVDKLDRTLQLETTTDTYEELILKRALAGAKQPISYASRAQISHRGGKLSE
jgi:hypothetical protein